MGHVFADPAIAAGRPLHQHASFVTQRNRQTVELQLHGERLRYPPGETAPNAFIPGLQLIDVEGIVQRHHRHGMGDRREGRVGRSSDSLAGRRVCEQLRVGSLETFELAQEPVIVRIGDLRAVALVVGLPVTSHSGPQFSGPSGRVFRV